MAGWRERRSQWRIGGRSRWPGEGRSPMVGGKGEVRWRGERAKSDGGGERAKPDGGGKGRIQSMAGWKGEVNGGVISRNVCTRPVPLLS